MADINQLTQELVATITDSFLDGLKQTVAQDVRRMVAEEISRMDTKSLAKEIVKESISTHLKEVSFPEKSIDPAAIDINQLKLTGDHIEGGIIKKFGSTGIDDRATDCRLTILDDYTVSENNFVTQSLTVKGPAVIEGDLIVNGSVAKTSPMFQNVVADAATRVKESLNDVLFSSFSEIIFTRIKEEGLDLTKITLGGKEIVSGNSLSVNVTESNLQKVGVLKELRVSGESLFAQTLYTAPKRVGINTLEPSKALSIWDEEVELGFGKRSADQAIIGTPRAQELVLSSNNKQNLTLNPDGSVTINNLTVSGISISASDTPPTGDAPKGSIVFNANPTLGGPLGWVSLGGARWANFGIID